MSGWDDLRTVLHRFDSAENPLPIWWRDDDAIEPTTALDRLGQLSENVDMPVHLAIIPAGATSALADAVAAAPSYFVPVAHGLTHANHAPADVKKAEFGATRPEQDIRADLSAAKAHMAGFTDLRPMFVPPWNRIGSAATDALPSLGFHILSTYGPRKSRDAAPGLAQVNTHLDPIDWHGSRSLHDEADLLARLVRNLQSRLVGATDATEPLGLLTHHLVHDPAIWAFSEKLLDTLRQANTIPWVAPKKGTADEPT